MPKPQRSQSPRRPSRAPSRGRKGQIPSFKKPSGSRQEKPGLQKRFQSKAPQVGHSQSKAPQVGHAQRKSAPKMTQQDTPNQSLWVWGKRPVMAQLENIVSEEKPVSRFALHVLANQKAQIPVQLKEIVELAKNSGIKLHIHAGLEDGWPLATVEGANHQRVCLKVPEMQTHSLTEVIKSLDNINQMRGCVGVVLDSIQDPANFGAILRSAAFFGAKFVVYAKNRQASVTSVVVRTSAGGIFEIKMVPVTNISRAMDTLKENGIWTLGTAMEESAPLNELKNDRPFAIVFGNEGKGIRQEVLRRCDMRAKIPTSQTLVDSLNVSVSAGIILSHLPFSEGAAE